MASKTALQKMWERLDEVTAKLQMLHGQDDTLRGEAFGIAECIAFFYPTDNDINWVRREAMSRWRRNWRNR